MQCVIMENTLIKLTFNDKTNKRAHDSQIVRTNENLKLSHGGFNSVSFSNLHVRFPTDVISIVVSADLKLVLTSPCYQMLV